MTLLMSQINCATEKQLPSDLCLVLLTVCHCKVPAALLAFVDCSSTRRLLPPMFPTCWTRQKAGQALMWAFLILMGNNWLLPHTGISYLPLEILNCSCLFLSVGTSFVFFNFLTSDFLESWRNIIGQHLKIISKQNSEAEHTSLWTLYLVKS